MKMAGLQVGGAALALVVLLGLLGIHRHQGHRIEELTRENSLLGADNAQLQQQAAAMARERTRLEAALAEREQAVGQVRDSRKAERLGVADALATDEESMDWGGLAVPDKFKRVLKRTAGPDPASGLPAGTVPGAGIRRGDEFGLAALGSGHQGATGIVQRGQTGPEIFLGA